MILVRKTRQNKNTRNFVAKLSDRPQSLSDLWEEWHVGIEGNKPAKLLTFKERQKVKNIYYKRKPIWDQLSKLVASGMTSKAACDKMYAIYGEGKSVSYYSKRMKEDKERGGPVAPVNNTQTDAKQPLGPATKNGVNQLITAATATADADGRVAAIDKDYTATVTEATPGRTNQPKPDDTSRGSKTNNNTLNLVAKLSDRPQTRSDL